VPEEGFEPGALMPRPPWSWECMCCDLGLWHASRDRSWGPFAEGRNHLFSDPTLSQIGAAHAKSVAQVVLRWLIQRQVAANPKSVRRERMAENLDVFHFQLTDEEMGRIAAMDTGASLFFDHRDPEMVSRIGNLRRT
jgi:2,5-diketo-D-gluconate reductase A